MAGKIYRRKKSSEFVTIDTHCLKNKDLKWDAKGLHSYLVQLPEDWQINMADLVNRSKDGRDATTSPMKALISAGYVVREMGFDEKGKFDGYDYFVFERPEHAIEWKTVNGKTVNGKTVNGKTATSKVLIPLSEVSKDEGEGTPPAEISKTLEAKEVNRGLVAPPPAEAAAITIHDPELPGVTIIEAVQPLARVTSLMEAEQKIVAWMQADGFETVKYRHQTARQKFDPDGIWELAAHYVSIYASTNESSKASLMRDPVAHFEAGIFKYLKNEQAFGRNNSPGNQAQTRNGNQQAPSVLPRSLQSKVG